MRDYKQPPKTLPRSAGHHQEWVDACRKGTPTESNFGFAGPLTETLLVGIISVRLGGRKLNWNAETARFRGDEEANRYLHYPYRGGWSL
jgi:hypothetical protein